MNNRKFKPWIIIAAAITIAAVAYPFYFNWWDHKNCSESGGIWDEAQGKCIEPRGAHIPDTEPAGYDSGGAKPRE
jgi:hypothetical protein